MLKAIKQSPQFIENISTKLMADLDLAAIFAQKLKEQQREKAALSQELLAIEHELSFTSTQPINLMALHYLVKNIDEIMKQADPQDKKELLRLLIREIEITPSAVSRKEGRQISRIYLHFDFTPLGGKKKSKPLLLKMAKYTADKHV
ncbi:hypothetical protein DHX103_07505 [Planococcus sp. X10-3]|uniref:hypothetical protein n=1 Tax=Planococcus sp. X10-3 TaxID=3061240 RepID=UPI003BB0BA9C